VHYGKDGTYLFVPVSIQNQGADSNGYFAPIVDYTSRTLQGPVPIFNISVDPTECAFHTAGGDKRLVIRQRETVAKRATRGIKRYSNVAGRLPIKIFGTLGTQREEIESQSVQLHFCIRDGNGISHCATFKGPYQVNGGEIPTMIEDEVRSDGPQNY